MPPRAADDSRQQPRVTAPSATVPASTVPPSTGPVTVQTSPEVTAPLVTEPEVTAPPVTAPPVTAPPITAPPITRPPITAPPVTAPPVTVPPTAPPTEPPTTQPATPIGLVLEVAPATGSATAQVGITGSMESCPTQAGGATRGLVRWTGVGNGVQEVLLNWVDATHTNVQSVTIPNLTAGGRLSVTFEACGVQTQQNADISPVLPDVSDITVAPKNPVDGARFTAGIGFSLPDGWQATSVNWDGAKCARSGQPELTQNSSQQVFTAAAPICQVSVVVTFKPPGGDPVQIPKQQPVDVAPTTTTTAPPTSQPQALGPRQPGTDPLLTEKEEQ